MVAMDYLYVANWSLWTDIKILLRTASCGPLSGAVTLHDPDCSTDFAARTGIQHMNLVFGHRSSVAQQICNNPSCAMASKDSRFSR